MEYVRNKMAKMGAMRPAAHTAASATSNAPSAPVTISGHVTEGAAQKGLPIMEQGIQKGGLKRPEDSKLLRGIAQLAPAAAERLLGQRA
mgnify:CR=1 FL=1